MRRFHIMPLSLHEFFAAVLRLSVWLVLLTIVFVPLERWFGAQHAPRPRRELFHNLVYYVISSLMPVVVLSVVAPMLAVAAQHVVPGHDPAVLTRYAAHSRETEGWIVRLDGAPR